MSWHGARRVGYLPAAGRQAFDESVAAESQARVRSESAMSPGDATISTAGARARARTTLMTIGMKVTASAIARLASPFAGALCHHADGAGMRVKICSPSEAGSSALVARLPGRYEAVAGRCGTLQDATSRVDSRSPRIPLLRCG